jgi:hypothetical protein
MVPSPLAHRDTDQSCGVYLAPLLALQVRLGFGTALFQRQARQCEKIPAKQLKTRNLKRPLGDPIGKSAACGISLWSSASFVVGSAVSSRVFERSLDSSDVTSEVAHWQAASCRVINLNLNLNKRRDGRVPPYACMPNAIGRRPGG